MCERWPGPLTTAEAVDTMPRAAAAAELSSLTTNARQCFSSVPRQQPPLPVAEPGPQSAAQRALSNHDLLDCIMRFVGARSLIVQCAPVSRAWRLAVYRLFMSRTVLQEPHTVWSHVRLPGHVHSSTSYDSSELQTFLARVRTCVARSARSNTYQKFGTARMAPPPCSRAVRQQ